MKSIEIGALSFVIAVWRGISRKNSRRSTLITRSMRGTTDTTPGPLTPVIRPSRNTTIRVYSATIRKGKNTVCVLVNLAIVPTSL